MNVEFHLSFKTKKFFQAYFKKKTMKRKKVYKEKIIKENPQDKNNKMKKVEVYLDEKNIEISEQEFKKRKVHEEKMRIEKKDEDELIKIDCVNILIELSNIVEKNGKSREFKMLLLSMRAFFGK